MKYKTLFRLILKVIGVWFIAEAIPELVSGVMSLTYYMGSIGAGVVQAWWVYLSVPGGAVVRAAIGLYLFFGGAWIVNCAIPSNRDYCHECGYDLAGNASGTCSECGTPIAGRQSNAT